METRSPTRKLDHVLLRRLDALRTRTRIHLAIDGVSSTSLAFVSICVLSFGIDRVFRLPVEQRAIMLLLMLGAVGALFWRRIVARLRVALPLHELARQVEKRVPSLDWRLVSAVQFLEGADPRGSRELATLVIEEAERAAKPVDFGGTLDTGAVAWRAARGGLVLLCGLALLIGFPESAKTWFLRCILLSSTTEWPKNTRLHISPYEERKSTTVALPRGADLAIIVSASGDQPSRMLLTFDCEASRAHGTRNLSSLGKGRFRYLFEKVVEDTEFTVEGGDDRSEVLHLKVVRPPWLEQIAIESQPPLYTKLKPRTYGIEDGEIALPAGTTVTIRARCTKKLKAGWLETRIAGARLDAPPDRTEAKVSKSKDAAQGDELSVSLLLDKNCTCSIDVRDQDDLTLERPTALSLKAIPDAPPKVQLTLSGIGKIVTPDATLPIEIKASDDYGLAGGCIRYKITGAQLKARDGADNIPGLEGLQREVVLAFNYELGPLKLVPGQFFSFLAEAADDDPKGQKRTASASIPLHVVTPEELLMDLIRQQHEQRRELEKARDEEEKIAQGLENYDAKVQERAPKAQRAIQKVVGEAAKAIAEVVEEMRNNKLLDERARSRLTNDVVQPLEALRDGLIQQARELSDKALAAKDPREKADYSKDAGAVARNVVAELNTIMAHMKRVADLATLVAQLREFVKKQKDLIDDTRKKHGD